MTHWVSHLLPILSSSSQFLLFTPLCPTWGLSSGFNIYLGKILHSFIWFQHFPSGLLTTLCMHLNLVSMSRLPPLSLNNFLRSSGFNIQLPPRCLSSNFLNFLHSLGFNIFTSPLPQLLHKLLAFILFQYLRFLPGAPQQLPALILLQYPPVPLGNFLHSFGFISGSPVASSSPTHLCVSTTSRIHAVSVSKLPLLVSPQLLACTVIWVQYLDFRFSSQQLLVFILVTMSNFPLSHLPLPHQFSAVIWPQYLHVPPFRSTPSCMHLVSISKSPTLCLLAASGIHFWVPKLPPASSLSIFLHVSSCISIKCLGFNPHLSTTVCAHPVSISNFPFPLCASQFPASISLHT